MFQPGESLVLVDRSEQRNRRGDVRFVSVTETGLIQCEWIDDFGTRQQMNFERDELMTQADYAALVSKQVQDVADWATRKNKQIPTSTTTS